MNKRVVITGLGALTPIGNCVDSFWENLKKGVSGSDLIKEFSNSDLSTIFGCELKNYNSKNYSYITPKIREKFDPFVHYALIASHQAIKDSYIQKSNFDKNRVGVIWGSGNGGIGTLEKSLSSISSSNKSFSPYFIPSIIHNIASSLIGITFGFKGVSFSPVAACSSSNLSIAQGYEFIKSGSLDIAITGGSESSINLTTFKGLSACKVLSTNNSNYKKASRPFDITRDGLVIGEGAGAIVLEEMNHAISRNAKIYAEIIGSGMSSDSYHIASTPIDGLGAELAMKQALFSAKITDKDVCYINPHATSTKRGDLSELNAINRVFRDNDRVLMSATKSSTGHLLGASGSVEAIICIKAINDSEIPATINTNKIEPALSKNIKFLIRNSQKKEIKIAMNNSFGFGGHNIVTIFKKYTP